MLVRAFLLVFSIFVAIFDCFSYFQSHVEKVVYHFGQVSVVVEDKRKQVAPVSYILPGISSV